MRFNQRLTIITSLCTIALILLILFIRGVIRFAHIFGNHPGISITQQAVWDQYHDERRTELQKIPKILHHIFHNWKDPGNKALPPDWQAQRQSCIDKTPKWEHKVAALSMFGDLTKDGQIWSAEDSRDFLEKEYPWFLPTYDSYAHPVQRVDVMKYFLMLHFGGIYIDLDNGCVEALDSLLYYPTWLTDGGHGTISNNILGSAPGHPFYQQVTSSLSAWNWNYLVPYPTVHYGSGQWFLGAIWDLYHEALPTESPSSLHALSDKFTNKPLTRIEMDMRPGKAKWVFFNAGRGASWNAWDAQVFGYIGNRMFPQILENIVLIGAIVTSIILAICWWRMFYRRRRRGKGYTEINNEEFEFEERTTENRG